MGAGYNGTIRQDSTERGVMSRILLALVLVAVSAAAAGLDARSQGDPRRIADPDEAVQRALTQIGKRYQGRVLSARPVESAQGGLRVRVKLLSKDGVIRIIVVDPAEE